MNEYIPSNKEELIANVIYLTCNIYLVILLSALKMVTDNYISKHKQRRFLWTEELS